MPCSKRSSAPRVPDDHIGAECPFYRSLKIPFNLDHQGISSQRDVRSGPCVRADSLHKVCLCASPVWDGLCRFPSAKVDAPNNGMANGPTDQYATPLPPIREGAPHK